MANYYLLLLLIAPLVHSDWNGCRDPKAKCVIRAMDELISDHVAWDNKTAWVDIMGQFFTQDMIYDTNWAPDGVMGNTSGIEDWFYSEHIPWNLAFDNATFTQMIFASEEDTATTTTYAKALWKGDLSTIPGSAKVGEEVTVRIFDFYQMRGDFIFYNWMLLDMVQIMYYAGYRVLPEAPLREDWVQPPAAMDGVPAPISMLVDPSVNPEAIALATETMMYDMLMGEEDASPNWDPEMNWYGPMGIGYAPNKELYTEHFLKPLRAAFSDRDLQVDMVTCEGSYCGALGWIHGRHTGPWLGEEATNVDVRIRFGFHYRVDLVAGVVREGYAIFDLPDAFNQMGIDLYGRCSEPWAIKK